MLTAGPSFHAAKRYPMTVIERIAEYHAELTEWRRDLHAHPEIGFEEERTSELIASRLGEFGCEVTRGLGKTGVVGSLQVGSGNHAIGLRADIDALAMDEDNQFDHRSQIPGRMHGCGHDGHTVMLLGAARYLAETRNFDGTVHFIFQPAEEGTGGAAAMVADGLFERFPVDAVFGMHNRPGLAEGEFAVRSGPMMAGGGFFDITIQGRGAHGARPETGIDPVIVAAHIATALQTIISRNLSPFETAVISVTRIEGGDAYNVIPERAYLRGTMRAFSDAAMAAIVKGLNEIAPGIAGAMGAMAEVETQVLFPPLINDDAEAAFVGDVAAALVGEDKVTRDGPQVMASEDFPHMMQGRPGAYLNIGTGLEACTVHNPSYDFNDAVLPLGASFWARLVETRLAK